MSALVSCTHLCNQLNSFSCWLSGTESTRDPQWQRQGQLSHADLRRDLRQVSVSLPILGQLGGAAAPTAPLASPAAAAHAPATLDQAAKSDASSIASPSASGVSNTPASPSPTLLSLLPDIMQVLNSETQAGESGRSLNISVSAAAMSPNASADDAPAFSGSLANATVESSPRRVDVQVLVLMQLVCCYTESKLMLSVVKSADMPQINMRCIALSMVLAARILNHNFDMNSSSSQVH